MTQPMFCERDISSVELDIRLGRLVRTFIYLVTCGTTMLKTLSQAELCFMPSFLPGEGLGGVNAMLLAKAAQKSTESLATEKMWDMKAFRTGGNN